MPLSVELGELRRCTGCSVQLAALAKLQEEAAIVRASENLKAARRAGDIAPDFTLNDYNGTRVSLGKLIAAGPVVITFYRGDWDQFCRLFLSALSAIHEKVTAAGAQIVALSPQPIACRDVRLLYPFPLLFDEGAQIARDYGLDFSPDPSLRNAYAALGQPEDCQTLLPVPASYIVDTSGHIVLSYVDSDFTTRIEPDQIVTALQRIQTKTI